jgi:NAD(P)-dependent dehydrogenase (short-subunit alcohol dehydrogenase family)
MAEKPTQDRGPVVITGASSGIGAACAIYLAKRGFQVFAGVRRDIDGDALRARTQYELTPLIIDVTDDASITAATQSVTSAVGERGLAGLVNNAGIVKPGPLEFQAIADLRTQLEVNVIGQIAVTQAFLPLIRRGNGRIVNVGSIGGRVAGPLQGAYSASKFAMEALTDSLRLELRQWGIPVALIEPGAIDTSIWGKGLAEADELEKELDERAHALYDGQIAAVRKMAEKSAAEAVPPVEVARAVAHALTSDKPKTRYVVGRDAKIQAILARVVPDRQRDWLVAKTVGMPAPE